MGKAFLASVLLVIFNPVSQAQYQESPPPASNPCGDCHYGQPQYGGGYWTTASAPAGATASVVAVTVSVITNEATNTTRTTTIYNYPSETDFYGITPSPTNSDGYVLHTATLTWGPTTVTTVLTWPTGYISYQEGQTWWGTLPVTLGRGSNASTSCSTALVWDGISSIPSGSPTPLGGYLTYPTPIPFDFPIPTSVPASLSEQAYTINPSSYDRNDVPAWIFIEDTDLLTCFEYYAKSDFLDYKTVSPEFAVYQTCSSVLTLDCAPIALQTQSYLTVTRSGQEQQPSSSKSASPQEVPQSELASPGPTTSAGAPKTSHEVAAGSTSTADEPHSSTATSFALTTDKAGSRVAILPGSLDGQETTVALLHTTTDESGHTVAIVAPSSPVVTVPSMTVTSFRITTGVHGQTVVVIPGTVPGHDDTISAFHTTADDSGQAVVVIAASSAVNQLASVTISSYTITTNEAGSTILVVSEGSQQTPGTFSIFRTTTDESGHTIAVALATSDTSALITTSFEITSNAAGKTVALVGSSGHQTTLSEFYIATDASGQTVAVIPASSDASATTTDIGGYVASGIGISGVGGESSPAASSLGTGEPNAGSKMKHPGKVIVLWAVASANMLICVGIGHI